MKECFLYFTDHKRLTCLFKQNALYVIGSNQIKTVCATAVPIWSTPIPPFFDISETKGLPSDNPELFNEILDMLVGDSAKMQLDIPVDIIKQMQNIDLKKIYNEPPEIIKKKKKSTVRKVASDFPVFENDRLSLVSVFNEVLFLANEGEVQLRQIEDDVRVKVVNS